MQRIESSALQLGDGQAKDIKFASDNTLLVLWELNSKLHISSSGKAKMSNEILEATSLLNLPYAAANEYTATCAIPYYPHAPDKLPQPTVFSNEELKERFSRYRIDCDGSFVPEKMEIRQRGDANGNETSRIVVLGSNRMQYRVFKLPSSVERTVDEDISMS